MNDKPNDKPVEKQIQGIRQQIDSIDGDILELINKRLTCAGKIGDLKEVGGRSVMDGAREIKVIECLISLNKGPIRTQALQRIFSEIISASREIQNPLSVVYLGPEATFTHMAAMKHFGRSIRLTPQPAIQDVFDEVEKGAADYGVVPVENSIEGAVNNTLDLFLDSELNICAEIYQRISHDLLGTGDGLKGIKTVYSHPQAFAQCRRWLRLNLPDASLHECASTGLAAQTAAKQPGSAAIASGEAAHIYHLKVLAPQIEDFSRNTTRFLVIGRDDVKPTGKDRTSIMFGAPHVPGALHHALKPLAAGGINMLKLESRPARRGAWRYAFFVDIDGHKDDHRVKKMMTEMGEICQSIRCLGSYPRIMD